MPRRILIALALTACLGAGPVFAQDAPAPHEQPIVTPVAKAAAKDVASIDGIVVALYDVISGPVGKARDWDRMRSLFIPGGRLMAVGPRHDGPGIGMRVLEVNDYVATSGPLIEKVGFHEREITRRMERFGHTAHVYSTYEGRMETESKVMRGINSIELMNDGTRWWIVSVYWESERPDNPLPKEYLPKS